MSNYTHDQLCDIAVDYLKKRGYYVVAKEVNCGCGEIPDAIGFNYSRSALIECKTSRSDFLADRKKLCRTGKRTGLGNYRFYLCEEGLIKKEELPYGWGLIYVNNTRVKTMKGPKSGAFGGSMWHDSDIGNERDLLLEYVRVVHEGKEKR